MIKRDLISSPADLLVSFFNENSSEHTLVLLSGERGAGKTNWLLALLEAAAVEGIPVGGIISPPVYSGGLKTAIDCLDARSGKRIRLAERRLEEAAQEPEPGAAGTIRTCDWIFLPEAFEKCNAFFQDLSTIPLLVIDELGPVEFDQGGGFSKALEILEARRYQLAVAVIRPALLERALQRWPWALVYFVEKGTNRLVAG